MRPTYLVAAVCCLLVPVLGTSSAGIVDPQALSALGGGTPYAVAVQGNYAYAASGAAVLVFDRRDPLVLSLVGVHYVVPEGLAVDIALSGLYAYVAGRTAGLIVLDISDPSAPHETGRVAIPGTSYAVTLAGDYAYVADAEGGLSIVNIADAAAPVVVGSVGTTGGGYDIAYDVEVVDGFAYLADFFVGVRVIDVRDPAAPVEVASLPDLTGALGLAHDGDYVYVGRGASMNVLQVSDPAAPVEVGAVTCTAADLTVSGTHAYARGTEGGLAVLDISNPTAPAIVGGRYTPQGAGRPAVAGNYVLLPNEHVGLYAIDVADPTLPEVVGLYRTYAYASSVAVSGDRVFLGESDSRRVDVLDVSHPIYPVPASYMITPGFVVRVRTAGTRSYVLAGDLDGWEFRTYDTSVPDHPEYQGQTPLGYPYDMAVDGSMAYVADSSYGLRVIDATDPEHPQVIATWYVSGLTATSVAVADHYAYVSDLYRGVYAIDVSDPASPTQVGFWAAPDFVLGAAVSGGIVYVAAGNSGLHLLDVHDPTHIAEIAAYRAASAVGSVVVAGSYAFLTTDDGMEVVGLTDLRTPVRVGAWTAGPTWNPGGVTDFAVSGGRVYATMVMWGMVVLGLEPSFSDVPIDHWASDAVERATEAGVVTGYGDGSYHPSEVVTRAQMAVYVVRALAGGDANVPADPATASFPDVSSGYWAYRYIEYAARENVVGGYRDGTYQPESAVDRGQMAAYIARALVAPRGDVGLPAPTPPATFADVGVGFWAYRQIEYCASQGVVTGYWDGTYRPDNPVTRDQMAVYVTRAFGLAG
jgi:hypothetical protein